MKLNILFNFIWKFDSQTSDILTAIHGGKKKEVK